VGDDPLARGTKYDAMMKLSDNVDGYAVVILLNDPDASFLDYVGTHPGADWHKIMGEFEIATTALVEALDLR
jgi:deoxyxylulose-5-phosphate synthase